MAGTAIELLSSNPVVAVRQMRRAQQLMLAGAFFGVTALIFFASRMATSPELGILYSDLEPQTAAAIVDELESRGVAYELTNGGQVIWVSKRLVASTRLDLSSAGLPDSTDGWSILDSQGITSSEFDQRVGYQRAMEGELAATIAVIDGVGSAKVHLVIPEQDLFVADEIMPSASVLLQMEGSEVLSPTQVQAVVSLVASSVEGLASTAVTVTDGSGRLLAGGDVDGTMALESDNRMRMTATFERDLERELATLLSAVVGDGRSVVSVAADLDFDAVIATQEQFSEPTTAEGLTLPQAETTRTEQYDNGSDAEAGQVTIETEILEGPAATGDGRTNYQLDERDVSYALNSVVTNTEKAPGAIRSLSVAVAIDEEVIDAERLGDLEDLVGAAVGVDQARGDIVAVNLLPFDVSLEEQEAAAEAAAAAAATSTLIPLIRTIGTIVMALVVLILGLVMLRKANRRKVAETIYLDEMAAQEQLALERAEGLADDELGAGHDVAAALSAGHPGGTEEDLLELMENQPDEIAVVLRQWLTQPDGVRR